MNSSDGRQPDAERLADGGAQLALGRLQGGRRGGAVLVRPVGGVEDRRVLEVTGHPDVGDRR